MGKERNIRMVYCGERESNKGTLLSKWVDAKNTEHVFPKVKGWHRIGVTYNIPSEDGGFFKPTSRAGYNEADKQIDISEKQIEKWKVESEMASHEIDEKRERQKIDNSPELLKALEPFGEIYYKANRKRQVAIEIAIIRWLRYYPHRRS
jgi:hypothetical protein